MQENERVSVIAHFPSFLTAVLRKWFLFFAKWYVFEGLSRALEFYK